MNNCPSVNSSNLHNEDQNDMVYPITDSITQPDTHDLMQVEPSLKVPPEVAASHVPPEAIVASTALKAR